MERFGHGGQNWRVNEAANAKGNGHRDQTADGKCNRAVGGGGTQHDKVRF
jgi:hypothetical protein